MLLGSSPSTVSRSSPGGGLGAKRALSATAALETSSSKRLDWGHHHCSKELSFTGSSMLCAHCFCGEHLEDKYWTGSSLPEPMAHPRDLPPTAGLSALLPGTMGPSSPTSPQEQLLPISEKLL